MFSRKTSLLSGMLLFGTTTCLAQLAGPQTVNISPGASIKLQANAQHAATYQWKKNGVSITGATSAVFMVLDPGSYTVIAYNADGCVSESSDPVVVIVGDPSLAVDMMITKTAELKVVGLNEAFEYNLSIKNNGPSTATLIKVTDALPVDLSFDQLITPDAGTATYTESTRTIVWDIPKMNNGEVNNLKIRVKAVRPGMIKNTGTVLALEPDPILSNNTSTVAKSIVGLMIPDIITPNGDGKNDLFVIPGLSDYQSNELVVMNRWGSPVYRKSGYLQDWGANGLSDGTYFYVLKVKTANSDWQELKGYITVLR